MLTRKMIRVSILAGLVFLVPQAFAQKPVPTSDPQTKPRQVKEEPAKAFKQFVIDVGPSLTLAKLIDSRGLTPGEYSVEARVRDHVSGQSLVQSAKFTIVR